MDPRVEALRPIIESFGLSAPTVEEIRSGFHDTAASIPPPEGVSIRPVQVAGLSAISVKPTCDARDGRILHLHGGAFVIGDVAVQTGVPALLALATHCEVIAVDYRVAPEHPCPAAIDDAAAAYEALVATGPIAAITGDSAGGALAVLTAVALRTRGVALPDCLVAFSPWVDVGLDGARFKDQGFLDAVIPRTFAHVGATSWLGDRSAQDPLVSPVNADLRGLPPTMIQVGAAEMLLDDSIALTSSLAAAGVRTALHVWPEMIHVFVAYPQLAPESLRAMSDAAAFIASASGDARTGHDPR